MLSPIREPRFWAFHVLRLLLGHREQITFYLCDENYHHAGQRLSFGNFTNEWM